MRVFVRLLLCDLSSQDERGVISAESSPILSALLLRNPENTTQETGGGGLNSGALSAAFPGPPLPLVSCTLNSFLRAGPLPCRLPTVQSLCPWLYSLPVIVGKPCLLPVLQSSLLSDGRGLPKPLDPWRFTALVNSSTSLMLPARGILHYPSVNLRITVTRLSKSLSCGKELCPASSDKVVLEDTGDSSDNKEHKYLAVVMGLSTQYHPKWERLASKVWGAPSIGCLLDVNNTCH